MQDLGVILSAQCDHTAVRRIVCGAEPAQIFRTIAVDLIRLPQNGVLHACPLILGTPEKLTDMRFRIVFIHGNLFTDDAAFLGHFFREQGRMQDKIADQVECMLEIFRNHLVVVTGVILGRAGVELTAEKIGFFCNAQRGP